MLLKNKNAIIYGGGGSIGAAVATAFAAEGAKVFLAGRTLSTLEAVAGRIRDAGGKAETAVLNALDEGQVNDHADGVFNKAKSIDISFNLIGLEDVQGTALKDISIANYMQPITIGMQTHFITSGAASRYMIKQGSGVILMLTANVGLHSGNLVGGWGVACAAIEGLSRTLASELGAHGVRVVCLRSAGSPDAKGVEEAFTIQAKSLGISKNEFQQRIEDTTLLKKLPSVVDIANTAVFLASDKASAITAAIVNLTCGAVVD